MKNNHSVKGTLAVLASFFLWGVLPIFWKSLSGVNSLEILAHRIIWSLAFAVLIIAIRKDWREIKKLWVFPGFLIFLVTCALICGNWLLYIWAVNNNHIVESSLGYFMNPLVNVLLGVIVLKEKLTKWQIVSFAIALIGVVYMSLQYGRLPWIALGLAFMFGTYGLLRKIMKPGAMVGLFVETSILSVFSLTYIGMKFSEGTNSFMAGDPKTTLLLICAGAVTAIPLFLFTYGSRQIKYSTVGFIQYVAPTLQLVIGITLYKEPFRQQEIISFSLIWFALIIYTVTSLRGKRLIGKTERN